MAQLGCSKVGISGREHRTVFVLSTAFFMVFSAFIGIQNLQSTLNSEGGLGVISLSTLYAAFIFSAILAPVFIQILSAKGCIISSFVSHVFFSAANFYPTFYTMIPVSLLLGLMTGLLWTSQGMYISMCAFSLSENKNIPYKDTLGKFHGIFLMFQGFPRIIGNILSSVILLQGQYNTTQNASDVNLCGSYMCPDSNIQRNSTSIALPDVTTIYVLMGVFVSFDLIGLLLSLTSLPSLPVQPSVNRKSKRSRLGSCFSIHKDKNLLLLIPPILLLAMSESFRWDSISKAYISCPFGVSMVGFTLATHGFMGGVSAILASRLSRIMGRKPIVLSSIFGYIATYTLHILWTPTKQQLPYMIVFVASQGIWEGFLNSQIQALLSYLFPKKTDSSFASLSAWKGVGTTLMFVLSNFLCVLYKLYLLLCACVLAFMSYIALEIRIRMNKQPDLTMEVDVVLEEMD